MGDGFEIFLRKRGLTERGDAIKKEGCLIFLNVLSKKQT